MEERLKMDETIIAVDTRGLSPELVGILEVMNQKGCLRLSRKVLHVSFAPGEQRLFNKIKDNEGVKRALSQMGARLGATRVAIYAPLEPLQG